MTIAAVKQPEPDYMTGPEYLKSWVQDQGGAEEVARKWKGKYTPGAIRHWCNGRRDISPERAVEIEFLTGGELDRVVLIFGTEFLGR